MKESAYAGFRWIVISYALITSCNGPSVKSLEGSWSCIAQDSHSSNTCTGPNCYSTSGNTTLSPVQKITVDEDQSRISGFGRRWSSQSGLTWPQGKLSFSDSIGSCYGIWNGELTYEYRDSIAKISYTIKGTCEARNVTSMSYYTESHLEVGSCTRQVNEP